MKRILSQSERDALAELVVEVERNTAGELVTVVLNRSSNYTAYRIGWATGIAVLFAAGIHLIWPGLPAMELLGAEVIFLAVGYGLLGYASLLRLVVPPRVRQQSTSDQAKRLFLDLGVTETRDRSGVLILLSELERRVEVLGDRGIHEHLGAEAWRALVTNLVSSLQGGRAAEGMRAVIENLGRELRAKFPPRADDRNELPNNVITDDR